MQGLDLPSQLFGDVGGTDDELYEADDEFVLTMDMPGFETDEIELAWDDGVLNVAAEHTDENRGRKKTDHRRFRSPNGRRRGDRRRVHQRRPRGPAPDGRLDRAGHGDPLEG
ncbi:molecular chaperone Hsp20 [Natrinema mahii]|nr:molecular chaperone Hsp20 [Natrinema mahii]